MSAQPTVGGQIQYENNTKHTDRTILPNTTTHKTRKPKIISMYIIPTQVAHSAQLYNSA